MAGIFFRRIFGQYRYYIVILLGAVVGSLMANLVIDDITDKIGMFNEDFNNAIMSVSLDKTLYLRYILKLRLKEYMCFMLVLFTPAAIAGIYIFMLFAGISSGLMISVCIMNMGIKGMFVYIVMTFPHYIIYAITIFILISIWETSRGSYVNINIRKIAMALLVSFILLLAGTLCEAYVNPGCLKMLLEHISYCV